MKFDNYFHWVVGAWFPDGTEYNFWVNSSTAYSHGGIADLRSAGIFNSYQEACQYLLVNYMVFK